MNRLFVPYETVFTVADNPFRNWWFVGAGLVFVAIGALIVFRPDILKALGVRSLGKFDRPFGWVFIVGASLWTITAGYAVIGGSLSAIANLNSGNCETVEGAVEDFHPEPPDGHGMESFRVGAERFTYSDFVVSPGFNHSASHGGPIRPGLQVRICYHEGQILRLEVAR